MSALVRRAAGHWGSHVAFAFLAMGGWAMLANRGHPLPDMLRAGLVQGAISGSITFGLKSAIDWLAGRLPGLAALFGPPAIAFAVSASLLTLIHTLAGTPELLATIAVPLLVSTTYAALYSLTLWRSRRVADD